MLELEYPFTQSKVRALKVGDMVSLTGAVFTGRDRFHKHLFEDGKCPVLLRDGAIYHCGPIVVKKDGHWHIRAAGPTTSIREEPYMSKIIEKYRVRIIIGKGGMDKKTQQACSKVGCVYLQVTGGAAALLASKIEKIDGVHFIREFGLAEALWELSVKGLPAVVAMDSHGRSLYKTVKTKSKKACKDIISGAIRKNGRKNGKKKSSKAKPRKSGTPGKRKK